MIYITGDKHGGYYDVAEFCKANNTTKEDTLIVLGDHGCLYYSDSDRRTSSLLKRLESMPIRFVMIRGNHDRRPFTSNNGRQEVHIDEPSIRGDFIINPAFPSVLFTEEYGWYRFGDCEAFVIGGAHSYDCGWRQYMRSLGQKDVRWFPNEQLSVEEMQDASYLYTDGLKSRHGAAISILSHTCPMKYLADVVHSSESDKSKLFYSDFSMEEWMDSFEGYTRWFCGHWHIDRESPPMTYMFHGILPFSSD